jgi:nitroreductase
MVGTFPIFPTKEAIVPDAIDLLKIRRSVKPREMSAPGPSPAELETILTIGARVPDHGKLTPWRFIVFEGDARLRAGEIIANVFERKNPNATSAFDRDVLDGLGLKADEKLAGFIHIGTPSKPSEDRPRPQLSDIVTRF